MIAVAVFMVLAALGCLWDGASLFVSDVQAGSHLQAGQAATNIGYGLAWIAGAAVLFGLSVCANHLAQILKIVKLWEKDRAEQPDPRLIPPQR